MSMSIYIYIYISFFLHLLVLVCHYGTIAQNNDDQAQSASTEYALVEPLCYTLEPLCHYDFV